MQVKLVPNFREVRLGTLGSGCFVVGAGDRASSTFLRFRPCGRSDFGPFGGLVPLLLGLPQSRTYGHQLLTQLSQLGRHLVESLFPVAQLLLDRSEACLLLLLCQLGRFHRCGVSFYPLRLGLALGLLCSAGSRRSGGDPFGGLGRHGLNLCFGGVRVGHGAQLLDQGVQLGAEVLHHPCGLPTELPRALARCVHGSFLVRGAPARLCTEPAPLPPCSGPVVSLVVAVLRRPASAGARADGGALAPSRGYPRAVNNLAVAALIATYAADKSMVDLTAEQSAITENSE